MTLFEKVCNRNDKKITVFVLQGQSDALYLQPELFGYRINKLIERYQMKKGIHPNNYRPVAFKDMSNDDTFITRSTIQAKETIEIDGVTYPLVKVEISNTSHPFYTGKSKLVDTAGRVDKFMSRYGNRNKK